MTDFSRTSSKRSTASESGLVNLTRPLTISRKFAVKVEPKPLVASTTLKLMAAHRLVAFEIPPRKRHWGRLMCAHQVGMVVGPRGKGKTWVCLGIAVAISSGASFLGHAPDKPRSVCYLDGEMDFATLQERVKATYETLGVEPSSNLRFFTPELFADLLPAINTSEGQSAIDRMIGSEWDVLIIDNYSAWSSDGRETAESWAPLMRWMLGHKHAGRSVMIVHHTGKNGEQRGSSRHEDAIDWSIALKPLDEKQPGDALRFVLEWKKCRHLTQVETPPICACMQKDEDGKLAWTCITGPVVNPNAAKARQLKAEGVPVGQIAKQLEVNRTTVTRWTKSE